MNYFIQFLIVFDLICFGVYFGGDIVCTALAKVRKKTDEEEFVHEAPEEEQNLPMVMEMLNYAEGAKEDGDKDVIDILMEETAARTHLREEYFSDYRRYQLMQVDKTRVLLACRVIINDLLGKLYRYDYNVGYDCLLDDGNSVSRKLKKSNEEMEVEEDAIGDR